MVDTTMMSDIDYFNNMLHQSDMMDRMDIEESSFLKSSFLITNGNNKLDNS